MEAEIGVMQAQDNKCLQPSNAGRGEVQILPTASEGSVALSTPLFQTSGFQNMSN